jgi:hypothetical protein
MTHLGDPRPAAERAVYGTLSFWTAQDLVRWLGVLLVGLAMLVAGWFWAAGEGHYTDQVGPATLAVGGLIVAGVSHALWMLRGRRAVGARYEVLFRQPWLVGPAAGGGGRPSEDSGLPVAGSGLEFFHRRQCPLAAGRGWAALSREEHVAAGRAPCGVCRP